MGQGPLVEAVEIIQLFLADYLYLVWMNGVEIAYHRVITRIILVLGDIDGMLLAADPVKFQLFMVELIKRLNGKRVVH